MLKWVVQMALWTWMVFMLLLAGMTLAPRSKMSDLLAFDSNRTGNFDIYLYDLDSALTVNITRCPANELSPVWDAENQGLSYHVGGEGYYLWDWTTRSARLMPPQRTIQPPKISPDGRWFVYVTREFAVNDIFLQDRQTNAVYRLTNDPNEEINPSWSPDGRWIAYASSADRDNFDVFVLEVLADGSTGVKRQITFHNAMDSWVVWMPGR